VTRSVTSIGGSGRHCNGIGTMGLGVPPRVELPLLVGVNLAHAFVAALSNMLHHPVVHHAGAGPRAHFKLVIVRCTALLVGVWFWDHVRWVVSVTCTLRWVAAAAACALLHAA
jgi:hypothetical protein